MSNIVVLDELTINKIAAGEVIERPASVIKEMVENSIDAGAKNINIEIKNGGISYIRITDDGKGIEKEDLELAFERHATSKIRQAEDLNEVKTMGFRGEALASIAAIAKVTMISKTKDSEIGNRIIVEGGNTLEISEFGCPNGTTITVENLFFNTPVRYKFLKKDYTESGYIEDAITRLALVHPEIAFKLINSGKTIIQTTGDGDIKNVIYSIYGKSVASACLNVNYKYEDITVSGVVGKPEIARSNRSNQIFFVNERYIKDRILSNAAEKAFKGMIPIGKFGFIILNLEMSPSLVDVNVHPAKLEVRFQEEQKVFKAVYYAIQDTLSKAELIANSDTNITGKLEKTLDETSEQTENTNTLSGLFRRITKADDKNFGSNNVIESIYKSKQETANVQSENALDNENEKQNSVASEMATPQEIHNKEEIKNTISEFMKMGQALTAEQIREKLIEISSGDSLNKEEIKEEVKIEENKEIKSEEENKLEDNEHLQEKNDETNNNFVAEEDEKYETKPIDAEGIEEITEASEVIEKNHEIHDSEVAPGNILANIVKERSQKEDSREVITQDNFEEKFNDMYEQIFGKTVETKRKEQEEERKTNASDIVNSNVNLFEEDEEYKGKIPYRFIGIAFKTYIIIEVDKELYIIDQHAAHERILYEKIKKNYYAEGDKSTQMMLLPDIITLTHKEMDIARDNFDKFEKAGFVLEEFGENTIKITGVPSICLDLDTKELFLETLDEINTVARTAKQEIEDRFIATIACKAAVKAGMDLSEDEITKLIDEMLALPNPFTCPHGRPTTIKLSRYDIEKKFARKQ